MKRTARLSRAPASEFSLRPLGLCWAALRRCVGNSWIHNDCNNLRICYEESGYSSSEFSGNGLAFVYPVALPSEQNFRDGHDQMPAALELYNISHGYRDAESGQLFKPPNRGWAEVHRCELRSPCHCLWVID